MKLIIKYAFLLLIITACSPPAKRPQTLSLDFRIDSIEVFNNAHAENPEYCLIHIFITNNTNKPFIFNNRNNIQFKVPFSSEFFLTDTRHKKKYPLYSSLKHQRTILDTSDSKKFVLILESPFIRDLLGNAPLNPENVILLKKTLERMVVVYDYKKLDNSPHMLTDSLYTISIKPGTYFTYKKIP